MQNLSFYMSVMMNKALWSTIRKIMSSEN